MVDRPACRATVLPTCRPVGFTLAELIVVVALVAVLVTLAAGSLAGLLGESGMRQPALEVVSMATDAKQRADREGRAWELRFSRQSVTLAPSVAGSGAGGRALVWDDSWTVRLWSWDEPEWRVLDEDEVLVWRVLPGALAAPLGFRLSDSGGRFVEIELDPLTAGIAREEWAL